jgi:hypothetical protein
MEMETACTGISPQQACKASVMAQTLSLCENTNAAPRGVGPGSRLVKVPRVIAEVTVQTVVEAHITLGQPATDIKAIAKHVFLNQCRLVPTFVCGCPVPKGFKLFLSGVINKNIQYSTPASVATGGALCGTINDTTVNVPFSCVTALDPETTIITPPEIQFNEKMEAQLLDPNALGRDRTENIFTHCEFFNERIFCELVSANITEFDRATDLAPASDLGGAQVFRNITEKIVVDLTIKLLQYQQICV